MSAARDPHLSDKQQADQKEPIIFSVGHSTRKVEELVTLLKEHGVKLLVDIRTVPKSRTNPQFNKDTLQEELPQRWGLQYAWMGKELGGLRNPNKDLEVNKGWDNGSFRGYADYMQTDAFAAGVQQLVEMAHQQGPLAMMCAETSHYSCHRRLVSDALMARGISVRHLSAPSKPAVPHEMTEFAHADGTRVTYPPYPHTPKGKGKRTKRGVVEEGPMDAFVTRDRSRPAKRSKGSGSSGVRAKSSGGKGSSKRSSRGGKMGAGNSPDIAVHRSRRPSQGWR